MMLPTATKNNIESEIQRGVFINKPTRKIKMAL